ncbi:MAG TPA: restriction endonuclease subunit S [bacterium]
MNNINSSYIDRGLKDWEIMTLDHVIEIFDSKRIPLSEIERAKRKGRYPYCGANGILDHIDNYIFDGEYLLLAEDGGLYGKYEQSCYLMTGKFWVNNHAHILQAIEAKSSNKFLLYLLNFMDLRTYIVGSTRVKLNQEDLRKIRINLPPLPEQKKIAEILSTVDEAITQVDTAIEKTERLKKGLMQELLTKGIGHKQFKDTEIGSIPKEWEVKHLGDVTEINKDAKDLPMDYPDHKFLYIDIDSVENGTGKINQAREIMGRDAPSRARRVVYLNDVIMSTVRPYLKAFALIPKNYDGQICSTGFAVLTCKAYLIPQYLLCTLFSKVVIDQCNKMMIGGQYPALNSEQVSKITIPMPLLGEQQQISDILANVDEKVEVLKTKKQKFEKIKKGLMDDLLTGAKKVKT